FVSVEMWSTQLNHVAGESANEIATMTAALPTPIARFRHSRRTTHHSAVTPGAALERTRNAYATGERIERTSAAPISRWMLPWYSSDATGGNASQASDQSRASHTRT